MDAEPRLTLTLSAVCIPMLKYYMPSGLLCANLIKHKLIQEIHLKAYHVSCALIEHVPIFPNKRYN